MAKSAYHHLLDSINEKRITHADTSLSKPKERTEFEYGRVCGYHQALIEIIELSRNIEEEEKNRE